MAWLKKCEFQNKNSYTKTKAKKIVRNNPKKFRCYICPDCKKYHLSSK